MRKGKMWLSTYPCQVQNVSVIVCHYPLVPIQIVNCQIFNSNNRVKALPSYSNDSHLCNLSNMNMNCLSLNKEMEWKLSGN
jgi:hypothetical protein